MSVGDLHFPGVITRNGLAPAADRRGSQSVAVVAQASAP